MENKKKILHSHSLTPIHDSEEEKNSHSPQFDAQLWLKEEEKNSHLPQLMLIWDIFTIWLNLCKSVVKKTPLNLEALVDFLWRSFFEVEHFGLFVSDIWVASMLLLLNHPVSISYIDVPWNHLWSFLQMLSYISLEGVFYCCIVPFEQNMLWHGS